MPSIVLVKNIKHELPCPFAANAIELGADLILKAGGTVINPLIVKRVGIMDYELMAGTFEYWCAKRAREKDLARGESINAFIYENEELSAGLIQQVEFFRTGLIEQKTEK